MNLQLKLPIRTTFLSIHRISGKDSEPIREIADRINFKSSFEFSAYHGYKAFDPLAVPIHAEDYETRLTKKIAEFKRQIMRDHSVRPWEKHHLAIRLKENKNLIGYIGISAPNSKTCGEGSGLEYFMHPMFIGRGLVTEACIALLKQYFAQHQSLDATVNPGNKRSSELLERLGGKKTNYIECLDSDGNNLDLYEITRAAFSRATESR